MSLQLSVLFAGKSLSRAAQLKVAMSHGRSMHQRARAFSSDAFGKFTPTEHLYNMKPSLSKISGNNQDNDNEEEDDKNLDDYFEDSMIGDVDPSLRIGKVLFKVGRSKSKTSIPHPEWFRIKRDEICSYRSTAQIRRCLKSWMVDYDREYQKKFMSLPLQWRKDSPLNEKDTKATVVYGPEETVAYAHYFMGSRFSVLNVILSEISTLLPNFKPTNVVDFGCGPGTGGAAAINAWPNKVEKYSGIDMSKSMLEAARVVIEGGNQNVGCVLWDKMGDAVKRAEGKHERFQLGILAYTLSELASDSAKKAAVQILFELLDVGGVLVIVEDGNPRGSHLVRTARQFLLDNFMSNEYMMSNVNVKRRETSESDMVHILRPPPGYSHDDVGAKTIAPCTHDKPCPLKNMFCSFNQRVRSSMLRKDNEEKYSYVVIQKIGKNEPSTASPRRDNKISSVLNEAVGEGALNSVDTWLRPPNPDLDEFLISKELGATLRSLRQQRKKDAKDNYMKTLNEEEVEIIDGNDDFAKEYESDSEDSSEDSSEDGVKKGVENDDESDSNSDKGAETLDESIFETKDDDEDDDEDDSAISDDRNPSSQSRLHRSKLSLYDEGIAGISSHGLSKEEAALLTTRNILKQYLKTTNKDDVQNLNDYLLEVIDWDEYKTPLYRKEWGRVIRSPIKKKGHVIVDSCTSNGFISRSTFSKSNLSHLPSLYTALRKTTWGGLFPATVKFDSGHENDHSLLKLKNKSNPKPGSFKYSKDYAPPTPIDDKIAEGRAISIDVGERKRQIKIGARESFEVSKSKSKVGGDVDDLAEEEGMGRARRRAPPRGRSGGFSISSLTNIDESDINEIIGNSSSGSRGGTVSGAKSKDVSDDKASKGGKSRRRV